MARSLGQLFLDAAASHPERLALDVGGAQRTYAELERDASRIAGVLGPRLGSRVAIFCGRSAAAYAGVLGALLSGAAYVPLSTRSPDARNALQIEDAACDGIVVDASTADHLPELLAAIGRPLTVVRADDCDDAAPIDRPTLAAPNDAAYVMFTSGSTGAPKGVVVSHASVLAFLDAARELYAPGPEDRMSQAFELTFDLSVFDVFMALGSGASLHVLSAKEMMAPARFITAHALTTWFSVPSVGLLLKGFGLLCAGAFPSLRLALFCGERLPADVARAFAAAAPNARVENLYGPTEATVACTRHVWNGVRSPPACDHGVVPIGLPFGATEVAIVDTEQRRVTAGERGELCLSGPQLAQGYLGDAQRTAERFVAMPWSSGERNRWYRTGDLAFLNGEGELVHAGRVDDQVKIRGYRVEMGEIEHALASASGAAAVAVVPWPMGPSGPTGVVGFVVAAAKSADETLAAMKLRVPDYMLVHDLIELESLPLTAHGKIDRSALRRHLEALHADAS